MKDYIIALLWLLISIPACQLMPEPEPPPEPVSTGGYSGIVGGTGGQAPAATGGAAGQPTARCQFVETRATPRAEMELNGRIINGQEADMGQYTGLCALRNANGSARCTAELLAPNWALTAGHCQPASGQLLICGCSDLRSTDCQRRTVATGYIHELYEDWSEGRDLALVRIEDPMLGIMPIPLSVKAIVGDTVHVAGYGRTCSNCATSPVLLENANAMSLISHSVCSLYYPGSITPSMLCARSAGSDAAPGDSGGFLGQEIGGVLHQIGVVSWGRDCTAADPGGNPTETCVGVYANLAGEVAGIQTCIGGGRGSL